MEQIVRVGKLLISLVSARSALLHGNRQKNEPETVRKCLKSEVYIGDPSRTRTCNPRSRNPLLYPVELWDRRGLHSIANMKNPLSSQVGCEPFSPFRRQIRSGGTALRSSSTQCCAPSISGVARLAPAMSHATFSAPSSVAMSPSPFSALLYVTRRSSAQGAPS